jgi:Uncharacterized conserved protein
LGFGIKLIEFKMRGMEMGNNFLINNSSQMLSPLGTLAQPVTSLSGVTTEIAEILKQLGIITIQDLATSIIFNVAEVITEINNPIIRTEKSRNAIFLPTDVISKEVLTIPIEQLAREPISIFIAIGDEYASSVESKLGVVTVNDLAQWSPYQTAKAILSEAYGFKSTVDIDPEAPTDLVPTNGDNPTERVQYEVLLFDEFVDVNSDLPRSPTHLEESKITEAENLRIKAILGKEPMGKWETIRQILDVYDFSRPLGSDGPLDISEFIGGDRGYDRPAIGGVLTFTHSWYGKGMALGNMIHSVALAPGESTKIAMVDWTRTTKAATSETIAESEQLFSTVSRTRSISEITRSVARDTQEGRSGAHSKATSDQSGSSTGGSSYSLRGPWKDIDSFGDVADNIFNLFNDSPQSTTSGTSSSSSTNVVDSSSWSTMYGQRNIAAEACQNIVDRTQQASQLARDRRASIIREVSQKESEQITTRTITNYNHMHALTIEYYEVVQLYRTVVEMSKADRCIFVPMKLLDFSDRKIVDRFRTELTLNGLRADVRAFAFAEPDKIAFISPLRSGDWNASSLDYLNKILGVSVGAPSDPVLEFPRGPFEIDDIWFQKDTPFNELIITDSSGKKVQLPLAVDDHDGGGPMNGTLHLVEYYSLKLENIRKVEARKKSDSKNFSGIIRLGCFCFADEDANHNFFSWAVNIPEKAETVTIFECQPTMSSNDLIQHLNENKLYYSQVIWRSLDPATIGMILSRYTWKVGSEVKSLIEIVDPKPIATIANYLVLRISGDDKNEKDSWLEKKNIKIGSHIEDIVPVPSGGVFAEAVLGRFNSAEKLDITRFWNWQDSPIPIQAPDIAPIQAGSHQTTENLTPGTLGAPVLNIVNPPSLPDPQGTGAILAAIQNGNMFRDISGLAATIGLSQAGLTSAQQGASNAAAQAGQNATVAAQLNEKITGMLEQLVASYFTGGKSLMSGSGAGSLASLAGGISGQGAKINQGKDMDKRGISVGNSKNTESGESPSNTTSNGALQATQSNPNESSAFQSSLGANSGEAFGILGQLLETVQGAVPATSAKAWPKLDRTLVMSRLKTLRQNANEFDQGCVGLCTAAAFYHHITQKEPLQFQLFGQELYEDGFSYLGKLTVSPGNDLRNTDYNALKSKYPNLPPQADWMLMSSLRDSENWFYDFEGAPDEETAMSTSAKEMSNWYEKTGFYSKVEYNDDTSLDSIKAIEKKANNHIALWISVKLLGVQGGTHMVTLESPIQIDEVNKKVNFTCWTWGEKNLRKVETTIDSLKDNYFGVIIATF